MRPRLTLKLAIVTAAGVAAVLGVFAYIRVVRETALFESDIRRDHASLAHGFAIAASATAHEFDDRSVQRLVSDADLSTDRIRIRWLPRQVGPKWQDGRRPVTVSRLLRRPDGTEEIVSSVGVLRDGAEIGVIEMREALSEKESYLGYTVQRSIIQTSFVALLCWLVITGAGWWLVQRPLSRIVAKVNRIGNGDLSISTEVYSADEMGYLAGELNTMCRRLTDLQQRTERATQAKLAAMEQLRHADRLSTVGLLAAGVAHELGTPLNVILARGNMIARGKSDGEAAPADAQIIVEQVRRMTDIIRQLLDFTRIRRPKTDTAQLDGIIRQTAEMLGPLAKKAGVVIEVEPMIPFPAVVDAVQISQVITNLVVNAIHAQPDGGRVRLSITEVHASPPGVDGPPLPCIAIFVADDGLGMPDEVRSHVFEPFFTTKGVGKGSGLGLSVAYGMVREHRGWIAVDSVPGRGSTFTVYLPRQAIDRVVEAREVAGE